MKIAVAIANNQVAQHFGHCEFFGIYDAQNNKITTEKEIPNPGHRPGFLPNFLHEMGVDVIIAGGMGGGAVEIFNMHNIETIVGAFGNPKDNAQAYLDGKLISTGAVCHEHEHANECE